MYIKFLWVISARSGGRLLWQGLIREPSERLLAAFFALALFSVPMPMLQNYNTRTKKNYHKTTNVHWHRRVRSQIWFTLFVSCWRFLLFFTCSISIFRCNFYAFFVFVLMFNYYTKYFVLECGQNSNTLMFAYILRNFNGSCCKTQIYKAWHHQVSLTQIRKSSKNSAQHEIMT